MNHGSIPPISPPPGVKTPGKPPYTLIGIGGLALIALSAMLAGCNSSASKKSGAANPLLGTWKLLDTNMTSVCRPQRSFVTYEEATADHQVPAIYVVNPTYVEVGYGGPNIEEWELHGSDDVTLRMSSPYTVGYGSGGSSGTSSTVEAQAQTNCRYHRK